MATQSKIFLKIVDKGAELPRTIVVKGKKYRFPNTDPSVCSEPFTEDAAKALVKRSGRTPFYAVATVKEVDEAQKAKPKDTNPEDDAGALSEDTVLAGTVTIADFNEMNAKDAQEFVAEAKLDSEVLVKLLGHEQSTKKRNTVTRALQEQLEALKRAARAGSPDQTGG